MPLEEMFEWHEFFVMENEAREEQRKKNKSSTSKPPKTAKPKRAK